MRKCKVGGAEIGRIDVLGQSDPARWSADTGRSTIFGEYFGECSAYGPFSNAAVDRDDREPLFGERTF